jgi:diguanylate cyclase (GGDEF)-like protein/PAS domain S-box-containing protein
VAQNIARKKAEFEGENLVTLAGRVRRQEVSIPLTLVLAIALVGPVAAVIWWAAKRSPVDATLAALRLSEARYRALVEESGDVTFLLARDGTIRSATAAARAMFGRAPSALAGASFFSLLHPDDVDAATRLLGSPGRMTAEWRVRGRTGGWVWAEHTIADHTHDEAIGAVVVGVRDISQRRSAESQLTHQALHDPLTRLANRTLFLNRVAHAVARAPRRQRPSAVLFLDLDDFKRVNDSLGHQVGDQLLVSCAGRLSTCVRPGDTIARMGGDEFAVLLEELEDMGHAGQIAERISTALRTPFHIGGREVFAGVSIGIAPVNADDSPDDVLRNADLAMYHAKGRDKGRWATFAPAMHQELVSRLELEADLRAAMDEGALRVEYQPIVALDTLAIVGVEALVRWHHPGRGNVLPSRFVTIAEETGLIVPMGRRILREACRQAHGWRTRVPGAQEIRIAVNVSGRHFLEPTLVADVREALDAAGLPATALTLEVSESVLMQQSDLTALTLRALRGLGVRVAVDDFGTGYSSLGSLQRFSVDALKIDRTFVEQVGVAGHDPALARAIVALGATLGIETVAEGIERPEQRQALREMGCVLGQGYLFAHPMEADAMERALAIGAGLGLARAPETHKPPRRTPGAMEVLRTGS